MDALESDLKRVLKVKEVDLGFFILAMHSLIEKTLKQKYKISGRNSGETFDSLMKRYVDDFEYNHLDIEFRYIRDRDARNLSKALKKIRTNHFLSNDVRHDFADKSPEDAKTTVDCFLAFANAEGWKNYQALDELKKELEDWDKHSPYQSEELKKAIEQIQRLKAENENLAKKTNDYNDLQNKLSLVEANEKVLQQNLTASEERLSKKDARLDEIRKKNNEQMMQFKKEKEEILLQLKDYESTRQYIAHLEKVAFYTKTRHDYESSVIKLSPEQNEILDQIKLDKDFLIKGAAGTGKSFVLLKALEKAMTDLSGELDFEKSKRNFRLLTYTKSLVKYNQYVTKILGAEVPEGSIITADSFLYSMLKRFFPTKKLAYSFDEKFNTIFANENFDEKALFTESQEFIWANLITKEDYLEKICERSGMKQPLKKSERILMWDALENVEKKLEGFETWPRNFAAKKILEAMTQALENGSSDFVCEYSFVDEAQDLPPALLAIIKKSTSRGVFLAGDSDQSIYRKGFNWNLSGLDIRGRTKILKTNFRNTNQIHEFAEKYRAKFKNMDKTSMPSAFRPGPPVEHTIAKNREDAINQIVQQTKMLLNMLSYDEENICIIANESSKLYAIQKELDGQIGVKSELIADKNFDFAGSKGVRLCTMQNCKGLDFPVVLFLADHRVQAAEQSSAFDSETFYEQQYNMVYVSLTRAMEMLHIFTVKNSGFEPFKDLANISFSENDSAH